MNLLHVYSDLEFHSRNVAVFPYFDTSFDARHLISNVMKKQKSIASDQRHFWYRMILYSSNSSQILFLVQDASNKTNTLYYLILKDPDYYEGRTNWVGSEFQIGTMEELKDYLNLLHPNYDVQKRQIYMTKFKLFKVATNRGDEVKIISSSLEKYEHIPPAFRWFLSK